MLTKKTKIICTMGPATDDDAVLKQLMLEGMDIARLNFSHGDHEEQLGRIKRIKKFREELGLPIAILLDTKGPEIRTGLLSTDGDVELKEGQEFVLTTREVEGTNTIVSITYAELPNDVEPGNTILIDDGLIEVRVKEIKDGTDIVCEVVNGGLLGSRKGVNVPNVKVNLPSITEKDKADIEFGLENGIDFIAASFIRNADAVNEIKAIIDKYKMNVGVISKIENIEGVENIDAIIEASEGVMIARGDLGVEIPAEEVPFLQKAIIKKCNKAFKPVVTATQMLDSMIRNPRPTRAEVTDVANAIYDGTDAIMLSGETAKGKHPVEAVRMMNQIAISTELHLDTKIQDYRSVYVNRGISAAVAYSAVQTAHNISAKCILASSMSGFTARIVSKFKPDAQIIGLSPDESIVRKMQLYWGVRPFKSHKAETTKDLLDEATDIVLDAGLAEQDDILVLTGGGPADHRGKGVTNMLKVVKIGE
ncbi:MULTISPECIES: pyruvate kinase [Anaerostipes]|uniref:pyruvate kinase n=1 Tax=Anaerostipes TaxID=207244 RepID=UPI000950D148|nr:MULTISPECIES: pyruvate kinase [Anaerostipes]MCI5622677.1 pyruvate kinase [Anaerostipes sp.]MDY2725753.1 pyruvate kinase [Anaerostipes faecalis]OLR58850.1 pyruvate kinase [Anaerostipes sp. 494a]